MPWVDICWFSTCSTSVMALLKTWNFCRICSRFLDHSASTRSSKQVQVNQRWYQSNTPLLSASRQPNELIYKLSSQASSLKYQEPVVFYRWPTMRHFRFISRFKLYQVTTMLFLLPPMSWWYNTGVVSGQTLSYALLSAIGATSVLSVLSYCFSRVAGEIALVGNKVRVSTLTFMGSRRELVYPLSSIVPFADSNLSGAVKRLEVVINGQRTYFWYSLRYGHIVDETVMTKVLGIV